MVTRKPAPRRAAGQPSRRHGTFTIDMQKIFLAWGGRFILRECHVHKVSSSPQLTSPHGSREEGDGKDHGGDDLAWIGVNGWLAHSPHV